MLHFRLETALIKPAQLLQLSRLDSLFWQSELATHESQINEYFKIPLHWKFLTLPELVVKAPNALTAGPFGTIFKAKDFRDAGVPIIQLRHVTADGFSWGQSTTFMDVSVYKDLHTPYTVRPGDILITKMGEPPGLACIYPDGSQEAMVTPDVIKASVSSEVVLPAFVVLLFNNPRTSRAISKFMKGGTRTRVSLDNFYSIPLPIPPIEEQKVIVEEVTSIGKSREISVSRMNALKSLQKVLALEMFGGDSCDVH